MTQRPEPQALTEALEPHDVASAKLPTAHGDFRIVVFRSEEPPAYDLSREHVALVMGDVSGQEDVLLRLHSECITGEVFGSLRCDCRQQLDAAQERIAQEGRGVVLYLRQEGRGIGLTNKIRAYALQDEGADTVDANLKLHLPIDARRYQIAAGMLHKLDVRSVRLLSNNPHKQSSLEALGIDVKERIVLPVASTEHSRHYLETKRTRLKHNL